jgi:hypothetical protein
VIDHRVEGGFDRCRVAPHLGQDQTALVAVDGGATAVMG